MKGLTIWQPHASMLACGMRRIETRSWSTGYRGPLLIHASKKWDSGIVFECAEVGRAMVEIEFTPPSEAAGVAGSWDFASTLGKGLAVVELVDCRPIPDPDNEPDATVWDCMFGGWGASRWGWVFTNLQPLSEPVEVRGLPSLWDVPAEIVEQVLAVTA